MKNNWTNKMKALELDQSFIAGVNDYESLITTSGRLKRKIKRVFKVKLSADKKNTVVTRVEDVAED